MTEPSTGPSSDMPAHAIVVPNSINMVALLGPGDEHLTLIEKAFKADVHVRGNQITLRGEPAEVALVERLLDELVTIIRTGQGVTPETVERAIGILRTETAERPADVLSLNILSNRGRTIRPKTLNQKRYVESIDKHTITFGIGPAGTGKTYLAMAKAVQALQSKSVNRIILTRPAVEAGERLGFLPGTLSEKIDPYLRPLYDALHDMLDPESIPKLLAASTIEVAPLAYMRGRAQPYDARVLAPEGFRPIGSLRVGDLVIGSDGSPTPVLGVYPQGRRPVYRVTTQDGASTVCCGEHLWQVATPRDRRRGTHRVLETRAMLRRLRRGRARRYQVPVAAPTELAPQAVPMDPYALGRLVGDASAAAPTAAPCTTPGSGTIGATGPSAGLPAGPLTASPTGATVQLPARVPATTLARRTSVPSVYLNNSRDVRLAVLQGLLDTDGGQARRHGRSCHVRFSTPSARLRDDVVFLVRSLGGIAHTRTRALGHLRGTPRRRAGDGRDRDVLHVVDLEMAPGVAPFRAAGKREVYERRAGGRPARFIDTIQPAGEQDTVCIQVAAEDSLYVTDDFLLTHNTLNDAFVVLDEAQNTSPEQMKMFLTRLGFGSKMVVTGDVTQVDLPSGTRSGLRIVEDILTDIEDVSFNRLTAHDVVRHRLVGHIVAAYDEYEARGEPGAPAPDAHRRGPRSTRA